MGPCRVHGIRACSRAPIVCRRDYGSRQMAGAPADRRTDRSSTHPCRCPVRDGVSTMKTGPLLLDYGRSRGPARPVLDTGLLAVGFGLLAVVFVACLDMSGKLQE